MCHTLEKELKIKRQKVTINMEKIKTMCKFNKKKLSKDKWHQMLNKGTKQFYLS